MIHEMKLNASPFQKVASGSKSVELRLFDEKRRRIDLGDIIIFSNCDDPMKKQAVTVKSLYRYSTFKDLFMDIPLEKCGYSGADTPEVAAKRMTQYYTDDQVQKYGILGIEIELADTQSALKQLVDQNEGEFDRLFPDGMK